MVLFLVRFDELKKSGTQKTAPQPAQQAKNLSASNKSTSNNNFEFDIEEDDNVLMQSQSTAHKRTTHEEENVVNETDSHQDVEIQTNENTVAAPIDEDNRNDNTNNEQDELGDEETEKLVQRYLKLYEQNDDKSQQKRSPSHTPSQTPSHTPRQHSHSRSAHSRTHEALDKGRPDFFFVLVLVMPCCLSLSVFGVLDLEDSKEQEVFEPFKARPVPEVVYKPLYKEMEKRERERREKQKQRALQLKQQSAEPFSPQQQHVREGWKQRHQMHKERKFPPFFPCNSVSSFSSLLT